MKPRVLALRPLAVVLLLWLAVAPSSALGQGPDSSAAGSSVKASDPLRSITVGSKNFTENRLLAEIMAQLLEDRTDLEVRRRANLGGTLVVFSALKEGQIDLYPEYTGTGWAIVLKREDRASDPLRTYLIVEDFYREQFGIEWLAPFGFSNSYAVAIREDTAEELDISRVSDLKDHEDELEVGWSLEFMNREDGYPGLSAYYDLDIQSVRGMEHGLAYEAIKSGNIDITDAYSTDGKLLRFPVRILEDDRGFFPPYDCAPIIRSEVLEHRPEIAEILNELAFTLPDERMQKLNFEVEEKGRPFEEVARSYLEEEGLLQAEGNALTGGEALPQAGQNFFELMWARRGVTLDLVVEHLVLTGIAVGLAILLAVPLGIFLTRRERLSGAVLGTAGVIQTIPSLALLAFMIPIPGLGLGARSAVVALFLYALLPILRNTYTGIREVDDLLIEAARGMGLYDRQILWRIELPLAMPTIMAGIRTSTVISIGIATLAAFIGAGGLGEPIVTGLQLNETQLILSGAVPAALLALLVDWLLGLLDRVVAPRR